MADEKTFEKRMKKLKSSYHEMPSFSSVDKITKEIEEQKENKNSNKTSRKKKWLIIGSSAAAVFIGFSFLMSTIFSGTNDFASESAEYAQDKSTAETNEGEESAMQAEMAPLQEKQYNISEADRPLIKRDTIQVEGMVEEKTFHLYKNEALGFSTYYPEDMRINVEVAETKKSVTFFADFNGKSEKNTFLRLQLPHHQEQSIEQTIKQVEAEYANNQLIKREQNESYLSEVEYEFTKKEGSEAVTGWISIFTHHNQTYLLTVQYVPEMRKGMNARIDYILNQIVWQE